MKIVNTPTSAYPDQGNLSNRKTSDDINDKLIDKYMRLGKAAAHKYFSKHKDIIDINHQSGCLLYIAVRKADKETVNFLFAHGANAGLEDALVRAACEGNEEIVQLLVNQGADPSSVVETSAYDNRESMKNFIDQLILAKNTSNSHP